MAVGMDTLAGIAIQAVADHHLPRCASGMRGIAESLKPPIIDELYLLNHHLLTTATGHMCQCVTI
jgi:hypothetical protein